MRTKGQYDNPGTASSYVGPIPEIYGPSDASRSAFAQENLCDHGWARRIWRSRLKVR